VLDDMQRGRDQEGLRRPVVQAVPRAAPRDDAPLRADVPPSALRHPERSPLGILEGFYGRPLA
jgi:hypothetical protein